MATKAKSAIPDGYHTITPYLVCRGAAKAIDWYRAVLGAEELFRMPAPGGTVGHAELKIGGSILMLADELPDMNVRSPQSYGGTPVGLMVYVSDCDAVVERAVAQGAKLDRPVQDQFYGDRSGTVIDPFGHKWTIATHVEDLTPDEMRQRAEAWAAKQKS